MPEQVRQFRLGFQRSTVDQRDMAGSLDQFGPELLADCGDLFLHFPYHMRDPAHRLHHGPMPPPAARQALTVDLLKALPTWHLPYHAVFAHPTAERIALLRHPTLLMAADGDPLGGYLDAATALVTGATSARMPRDGRAPVMEAFLAEAFVDAEDGDALLEQAIAALETLL